jgi:Protein of unknown function (DUF2997)
MSRVVTVTIDKDGSPTVHVCGVKGPACLNITKELEKAFNGKVLERKETAEFRQTVSQKQTNSNS